MYKFLVNNGQRLGFGVGLLVTVLFLISVMSGLDSFSAMPEDQRVNTGIFDIGIRGALILIVLTAAAIILFGIYQIADNFKSSAKGIIGVAILALIFVVAYSMSSGQPDHTAISEASKKVGGISEGQMKFISGSITTAGILVGVAALAFVVSELRNFFK
jgi:hypothetical protein